MYPISSKDVTFVTIEDDNSEHLISHDELGACMNSKKYIYIKKRGIYFSMRFSETG